MGEQTNRLQAIILSVIDLAAIIVSFGIATFIRHKKMWDFKIDISTSTVLFFIIIVYILISFFRNTNKDFFQRGLFKEFVDVIKGVTFLLAAGIIALFAVKRSSDFSRLAIGIGYALSIVLVYLCRVLYKQYLTKIYKKSSSSKRLVIVALYDQADEILEHLPKNRMWAYKLEGFIFLDADPSMVGQEYKGIPILGNYHNMYDCVVKRTVDEVFIHIPCYQGEHVAKAVEAYEDMGITVNLNIQVYNIKLEHRLKELRNLGDYYVVSFQKSVISMKMLVIKRIMDVLGALIGLVFTGIITIILAPVLLLESPGPLFFSQTRVGRNGRLFKIYKFRSMYVDAEERKKELMARNEMNGLMFKMEKDPRITKVGRFIRKTSLDEFPQFLNVLKGDMSLIGTRPPTLDEFEQYKSVYKRRLSIRPGITGLWQVSGRSDITNFEDVLALDVEYIDNWSLGLDIKILCKTVLGVFRGSGAR